MQYIPITMIVLRRFVLGSKPYEVVSAFTVRSCSVVMTIKARFFSMSNLTFFGDDEAFDDCPRLLPSGRVERATTVTRVRNR